VCGTDSSPVFGQRFPGFVRKGQCFFSLQAEEDGEAGWKTSVRNPNLGLLTGIQSYDQSFALIAVPAYQQIFLLGWPDRLFHPERKAVGLDPSVDAVAHAVNGSIAVVANFDNDHERIGVEIRHLPIESADPCIEKRGVGLKTMKPLCLALQTLSLRLFLRLMCAISFFHFFLLFKNQIISRRYRNQ
jgi:hypothetical protein